MTNFLPVTKKDMENRGWQQVDFVLVTGDAYVNHPSFGTALISRMLSHFGDIVAILPQPDWRSIMKALYKCGREEETNVLFRYHTERSGKNTKRKH